MSKYKIEKVELEREVNIKTGFIIPVRVRPIKIMQGYNGPWSHFAYKVESALIPSQDFVFDDSYSVDFEVPFGTEVLAAKEGIVEYTIYSKRFYEGPDFENGIEVSPSFIVINHHNCFSLYSHMGEFEPWIDRGYVVKKGEIIGKTGRSGWVGPIPHLHFEIFQTGKSNPKLTQSIISLELKNSVRFERISQPVKFEDYDGPLEHKVLHP